MFQQCYDCAESVKVSYWLNPCGFEVCLRQENRLDSPTCTAGKWKNHLACSQLDRFCIDTHEHRTL